MDVSTVMFRHGLGLELWVSRRRLLPAELRSTLAALVIQGVVSTGVGADSDPWQEQFGTQVHDVAQTVVVDGTDVLVAGFPLGAFDSDLAAGDRDAFVASLDAADGSVHWVRQTGTPALDKARGVAAGQDRVAIVGTTCGTFAGEASAGACDVFAQVRRRADGSLLWTQQFGSSVDDEARAVVAGPDALLVAGGLGRDSFVQALTWDGRALGRHRFGSVAPDQASALALTGRDLVLAGSVLQELPGQSSRGGRISRIEALPGTQDATPALLSVHGS